MRYILRNALFAACCLLAAPAAEAHRPAAPAAVPPYVSTTDLGVPVRTALAAHAAGRRVIAVFDIDNTLLTAPQDLGSDTWFNWQKDTRPDDFAGVLKDSNLLIELGAMTPTQPDGPALVHDLQAAGIPVYALSARDPGLRGATEQALAAAGIDLSAAPECGRPLCTRRGKLNAPQIQAAAHRLHVTLKAAPRPVTVSDGVMMVSGQDKGVMLHLLLASLKGRYDQVYFVDDTFQNIRDVRAAASGMRVRVMTYSYERFWPDAKAFLNDPARQAKAAAGLKDLKAGVCAAIDATDCGTQP